MLDYGLMTLNLAFCWGVLAQNPPTDLRYTQLQGFLLGRPMPAQRLPALWADGSARQTAAA